MALLFEAVSGAAQRGVCAFCGEPTFVGGKFDPIIIQRSINLHCACAVALKSAIDKDLERACQIAASLACADGIER